MGKICIGNLINENGSLAIFYLEQENPNTYKVSMDGWDVEICKDVIAAFTTQILDVEQLHKRAYMVCEQVLDILALKRREYLSISDGVSRYILCYQENDLEVAEIHDIDYLPICVTSEIKELPDSSRQISMMISFSDTVGDALPSQIYAEEQWMPVFRYYRLACLSHNLYDAYRWMYLVFEQLLQLVEPIRRNDKEKICEKEHIWLRRALEKLESKLHVFQNLYGERDSHIVIARFMQEQYRETRCRMFHAKGWVIVPNDELEQKQLQMRYQELKSLCTAVLNAMGILKSPYGVMTYQGFWLTMKTFWEGKQGFLCDQKQEVLVDESVKNVLPKTRTVVAFAGINEVRPGTVDMCFSQIFFQCEGGQRYVSCGIELDNVAMMVGKLPMELSFIGDVRVEMHMVLQMVNKGEVVIR